MKYQKVSNFVRQYTKSKSIIMKYEKVNKLVRQYTKQTN